MYKNNPYLLTLPELMSAKTKLAQAAAVHDPNKVSFKGFDSVALDATMFRQQLRRNMGVNLTDAELGALVMLFDKDGDGFVDSVEFINEYMRLGKKEKTKIFLTQKELNDSINRDRARQAAIRARKLHTLSETRLANTWTEADDESALAKIKSAAKSHDPLKGGLEGFYVCNYLTPVQFLGQMRRNFELYFTPAETASLVHRFDTSETNTVDCRKFVMEFFRMGDEERNKDFRRHIERTRKMQKMEKERQEERREKFEKWVLARMDDPSDSDKASAYRKIRTAAAQYKKSYFIDLQKSFESKRLNPTQLRELLRQNFNIIMSPAELTAVVEMFDFTGDGLVACNDFISHFFRTGIKEQSKVYQRKLKIEREHQREAAERQKKLVEHAVEIVQTSIVWPILPSENDTGSMAEMSSSLHNSQESLENAGLEGHDANAHKSNSMDDFGPMVTYTRAQTAPSLYTKPLRLAKRKTLAEILSLGTEGSSSTFKSGSVSESGGSFVSSNSGGGGSLKSKPLSQMFPKASKDTREFLDDLEAKEAAIRKMKLSPKGGAIVRPFEASIEAYGSSLDEANWNFSQSLPNENQFRALTSTDRISSSSHPETDGGSTPIGGRAGRPSTSSYGARNKGMKGSNKNNMNNSGSINSSGSKDNSNSIKNRDAKGMGSRHGDQGGRPQTVHFDSRNNSSSSRGGAGSGGGGGGGRFTNNDSDSKYNDGNDEGGKGNASSLQRLRISDNDEFEPIDDEALNSAVPTSVVLDEDIADAS